MEPFLAKKFFDFGFMTWVKGFKWLCVISAIIGFGWAIYTAYIKPHTNPTKTTSQNAEEIVNNDNAPRATFGCASLKVINYYKNIKPKVEK